MNFQCLQCGKMTPVGKAVRIIKACDEGTTVLWTVARCDKCQNEVHISRLTAAPELSNGVTILTHAQSVTTPLGDADPVEYEAEQGDMPLQGGPFDGAMAEPPHAFIIMLRLGEGLHNWHFYVRSADGKRYLYFGAGGQHLADAFGAKTMK